MDITALFKACVKTMKTRNKAMGLNDRDNSILSKKRKIRTNFASKAKEVLVAITKMKEFLLEHRKEYINANHFLLGTSKMTDSERDKIDSDAQAFMQMCIEIIKTLKTEVKKTFSPQMKEHQENVIALINQYLKAVCKIYSGQKAIRVKQAVDKQKLLRLESGFKKKRKVEFEPDGILTKNLSAQNGSSNGKNSLPLRDYTVEAPDVDLSPEELRMLEEENKRLYEDMNMLVDEVKEIEGKVVEIGRLQEILSEKVLQQDQDINRISDLVVGTTENIKEGNEELREAMKKNAGLRIWILFFLIVLSFSLLFLDWYSP